MQEIIHLYIYANNFPVLWYLCNYSYRLCILIAPFIHRFARPIIVHLLEEIDTRYWYICIKFENMKESYIRVIRNIVSYKVYYYEIRINIFGMNTHEVKWGKLHADPFHTPFIQDEKVKSSTHNRIVKMHIFLSFSCVLSMKARYFC